MTRATSRWMAAWWVAAGAAAVVLVVAAWRGLAAPEHPDHFTAGAVLPGTADAVKSPRLARSGPYVLLCDEQLGFGVWDLSDPRAPSQVTERSWTFAQLDDVKRDGDLLLVEQPAGPTVLDVSDPTDPRVLSRVGGRDVVVIGERIYTSHISNVRSARLDGSDGRTLTPELPYAELARIGEDHLLAVSEEETEDDANVLVWSAKGSGPPTLVHESTLGSVVQDVAVLEQTAYVATTDDGVVVYDVSRPAEPRQVGRVPGLVAFRVYVDPEHRWLLVQHDANAIHLLDVSQPHAPRPIAKHELRATGVAAGPGEHVVAASFDAVRVLRLERDGH